jgi:PPE family
VPPQPPIASIPELPALPSIGGEQFSADLHSGPGSADLRDFSRAWHNYSQDITHTADDTRSVGGKVNEHWSSGHKAANNITDHANYLDSVAAWAERLSVAAESVAHAFDIAKQDTPTPDEFSDAESDVMEAAALMAASPTIGMIEYQQATSRYAELVAKAEEAAKQYHALVGAALTGVGHPMVPCPPIASKADIPDVPLTPASNVKIPEDAPKSITGYTKHAEDQIAGRDGGVGVRRDALEDAFNHPVRDVERLVDNQGRVSFKYTGENATVVVNEQGKVITGWANNRSGTPGGTGG